MMTVSCCSWWWSDKTIKMFQISVDDLENNRAEQQWVWRRVCLVFFTLYKKKKTVVQSDRVSSLALPEETWRVSTLSSRDINTFNKVNMSLWPRVSSTFTVQRNMAKLHRCVQKYTEQSTKWQCFSSRCWNDARSTSCVCVCVCVCVYVCVCQSMSSWSRGSFSPAEVLDEAPPSRLFLCIRTEERGCYKVFRGRRQELLFFFCFFF